MASVRREESMDCRTSARKFVISSDVSMIEPLPISQRNEIAHSSTLTRKLSIADVSAASNPTASSAKVIERVSSACITSSSWQGVSSRLDLLRSQAGLWCRKWPKFCFLATGVSNSAVVEVRLNERPSIAMGAINKGRRKIDVEASGGLFHSYNIFKIRELTCHIKEVEGKDNC